jgi:hypothetical protein
MLSIDLNLCYSFTVTELASRPNKQQQKYNLSHPAMPAADDGLKSTQWNLGGRKKQRQT